MTVFVAPGNAGIELEEGLENLPITAIPDLVEFARKESIAFTVVGPEAPLVAGVADALREALVALDPDKMTPREALDALYRLKASCPDPRDDPENPPL